MPLSLRDIATKLSLHSSGDAMIEAVAALEHATAKDIVFINKKSYLKYLPECKAAAVIIKPEWQAETSLPCLLSDDPYYTYAEVCHLIYPDRYTDKPKIADSAVIAASASIGDGAVIGANVVIGEHAVIGKDCYIAAGAVIQNNVVIGDHARIHANVAIQAACHLGHRIVIHPGAVIGSDGFGFAPKNGQWLKIPQVGRVLIGDDVEIGANTTIDRGANRDTIIAEGVKLDNLIQVAHNVEIGAHTAIAANTGIAGSAKIGKHCTIGGAAVILGHLSIADNVHVHAQSMVTNDIVSAGQYASGTPLEPVTQWRKNRARFKQLDDMARKLKTLITKTET